MEGVRRPPALEVQQREREIEHDEGPDAPQQNRAAPMRSSMRPDDDLLFSATGTPVAATSLFGTSERFSGPERAPPSTGKEQAAG